MNNRLKQNNTKKENWNRNKETFADHMTKQKGRENLNNVPVATFLGKVE